MRLVVFILMFLFIAANAYAYNGLVHSASEGLTGSADSLDAIQCDNSDGSAHALATGDVAIVTDPTNGLSYFYIFDLSSDVGETAPTIIVPNDQADCSTPNQGEWLLSSVIFGVNTSHTTATVTLSAADCAGQINYNGDDDAIDFTLPGADATLTCCFSAYTFDQVITVDVADGTDTLVLEGTALTAGYAIDSGGAAGEQFCVTGVDATYWEVISGTATLSDGGAD